MTAIAVISVHFAEAQKQYNVMDWKTDVTLNTFLLQRMHEQYDGRHRRLKQALTSRAATKEYIALVRKMISSFFGPFPPRSPLQPAITGTLERPGYRIEKIILQSFPGHHVTTNLYIPKGKGPFPAALFFCGHEDPAKATESYQKTAILLAKNGFVVFVVDPISQSERYQLTDSLGKPMVRGGTTEHTLLNALSTLWGGSTAEDQLWDNTRALDYLVTRKEVDTTRIGCLGNSGGAIQTIYFAAYDPRVKIFAPNSYLSSRQRTFELTGAADGCAQIPGEGMLEMVDYLIAAAPKPVMVMAGTYDFIDYKGYEDAFNELLSIYQVVGRESNFDAFTYDDGHGLSRPKREAVVTWFRKWFYKDNKPVKETASELASEKELFATATGSVATAFPDEVSLAKRNRQMFDSLLPYRRRFWESHTEKVRQGHYGHQLVDICHYSDKEHVGEVRKGNLVFNKYILRGSSGHEIPLPLLISVPSLKPSKLVFWFAEAGKGKIADSAGLVERYLEEGAVVVLTDLSGMGETTDKPEANDPKYYSTEYRNAVLALHTGTSLPQIRAAEINSVIHFIQEEYPFLPFEVHASGRAAVPALHAATIDSGGTFHLYQTIRSYRELLDKPASRNLYSIIQQGVLSRYDLTDLVKVAGKERIIYHD